MLAKQLIHKRVEGLQAEWFADETDLSKGLSRAFAQLCLAELLELNEEAAADAVVDGSGDFNIDAIWFDEPDGDEIEVTLLQVKYSSRLEKSGGIAESDVVKMIASLRHLFYGWEKFSISPPLQAKLAELSAYIQEGIQPVVNVYFCNNGQKWSDDAQLYLNNFINESPANREVFSFNYLNHEQIFALSQRNKPVECRLTFRGKFIDQEINFKRALIGSVPITDIAEVMNNHGPAMLRLNVREFLGFKKSVNDSIRSTLQDDEQRKNFYFLNNGITFICRDVGYAPGGLEATAIKLSDAHIINGGQTSRVIQEVLSSQEGKEEDYSSAYVLARIYKVGDVDEDGSLVSDITLATNSQSAISLRDLHANDPVQIRLEKGLAECGVNYIRKRHQKKVKRGDVRPETLAAVILAAMLKRPHEAKYRKAAHFSSMYSRIFDESKLVAADIAHYLDCYRYIENARKRPPSGALERWPFIPYSSLHLLTLISSESRQPMTEVLYTKACDRLLAAFAELNVSVSAPLEMIPALKRETLSRLLV